MSKRPSDILFNWKLLLATVLLIGGLSTIVFLIHRQQMTSLSTVYLEMADVAKAKGDLQAARTHLIRYLDQNQGDALKRAELAEIIDDSATTSAEKLRAVKQLLEAIGVCESKEDLTHKVRQLRRRLAECQYQLATHYGLSSYSDAIDQIALAADRESDPPMLCLFALCRFQQSQFHDDASWSTQAESVAPDWLKSLVPRHPIDLLEIALLQNPGENRLSQALAFSCLDPNIKLEGSALAHATKSELLIKAKATADQMLKRNIDSSDTWLLHYDIVGKIDPDSANETIETALEKFPTDPLVRLQSGKHYLAEADKTDRNHPYYLDALNKAEENFKAVNTKEEDRLVLTAIVLGDIQVRRGDWRGAVQLWQESLLARVDKLPLFDRIISNLIRFNEMDQAREALIEMDKFLAQGAMVRSANPNTNPADELKNQTRLAKNLWAIYHWSRNDMDSAIPLLEFLVSTSTKDPIGIRAERMAWLGDAYNRSEQWDKAGTAYEQATDLLPNERRFHSGAANAWSNAGRFSQALSHLNSISNKLPQDWLSEAQVILKLQSSSADPQLWEAFDNAIESLALLAAEPTPAPTKAPDSETTGDATNIGLANNSVAPWIVEFIKIRGRVLRVTDADRNEAIQEASSQLSELCRSQPQNIQLWRRTDDLLRSWNQLSTLNELRDAFRLANPKDDEAFQSQTEPLAKEATPSQARSALLAGLSDSSDPSSARVSILVILSLCEDQTQWLEAFDALLKWSEQSLARSKRVADAAFSVIQIRGESVTQDEMQNNAELRLNGIHTWSDAVQKIETQIKALEGDGGTEWKAVLARRLLNVAEFEPDLELQPILEVTRSLKSQRPLWATTHVIAGRLAERMGDWDEAILSFSRAISLGERDIQVFERLTQLLFQQGKQSDAIKVMDQLGAAIGFSERLAPIAIQLPGKTQNERMAIAQAVIHARPKDPMAWALFGKTLESTSRNAPSAERKEQLAKATEAFEKAAQLGGDQDLRVLNAEHDFYLVSLRDPSRLVDLLSRLQKATKLEPSERCLLMANLEQALGRHADAEAHFQEAMDAGGNRIKIGLMLGNHYVVVGKRDLAMAQLEKLYREYPKDESIRKSLVVLLQERNANEDWERINSILLDPKNANEVGDRRTLAQLLFNRGTRVDLERARTLLEEITLDSTLRTPNDSFLLARSCVRLTKQGRNGKGASIRERLKWNQIAASHFRLAIEGAEPNPLYIQAFGDFLLDSNQIEEAIGQFKQLSAIAPNDFITSLLDAKIKKAQGQPNAASDAILQWKERSLSQVGPQQNALMVHAIYQDTILGLLDIDGTQEADRQIDAWIENNQPTDEDFLLSLITFATENLREGMRERVEDFVIQRGEKNIQNATIHMAIGQAWLNRSNIPQAVESFRRVIAIDPNHVIALNNLACLIAESTGSTDESIVFIDQALKTAGDLPFLLDSKGGILMQDGKYAEAATLFEAAAAKGGDPRYVFHWYIALLRADRPSDADPLRTKIDVDALRAQHLSPDDRKELEKLTASTL